MAEFDITQIDSLEFDATNATSLSCVKIDDTHVAVAFGKSAVGTVIDILYFDGNYDNVAYVSTLTVSAWSGNMSICKIKDGYLAIAYMGSVTGMLNTVSYNVTTFAMATVDSIQTSFTAGTGQYSQVVTIDSTHVIVAVYGTSSYGYLITYSVDASGDNITKIDDVAYQNNSVSFNSLKKVSSSLYVLFYKEYSISATGYYGHIKVITLSSYNITIQSTFDVALNTTYCDIEVIDSTHFIIAYADSSFAGYLKTFSMSGYTLTLIDTYAFDATQGKYNSMVYVGNNTVVLAYCGAGDDGFIKSISFDSSYDNLAVEDSVEFDGTNGEYNSLISLDEGVVGLGYSGSGDDGYFKTFGVVLPSTGNNNMFFSI